MGSDGLCVTGCFVWCSGGGGEERESGREDGKEGRRKKSGGLVTNTNFLGIQTQQLGKTYLQDVGGGTRLGSLTEELRDSPGDRGGLGARGVIRSDKIIGSSADLVGLGSQRRRHYDVK